MVSVGSVPPVSTAWLHARVLLARVSQSVFILSFWITVASARSLITIVTSDVVRDPHHFAVAGERFYSVRAHSIVSSLS